MKHKFAAIMTLVAALVMMVSLVPKLGLGAALACGFLAANAMSVPLVLGTSPVLGNRLRGLSSNPTLVNFARDASQSAIRAVAKFLAPLVEVPDVTGQYKVYNAKNRYKRPLTKRQAGERATRIGFTASDSNFKLQPRALDFPVPFVDGMSDETALQHAQYGTVLLADAAGLDHEAEVIERALEAAGAGTDSNFASAGVDPIAVLDAAILDVLKAAKNGAPVKVLFGATALQRIRANSNVRGRIVSGAKNGIVKVGLPEISDMLLGNPQCEAAFYVEDSAPEGKDESMSFLLDNQILVFASNDQPNTMDPSFMKTLVPMGGWMKPGTYRTEDDREDVLKMDWSTEIIVSNSSAVKRINATAA